MAGFGFETISSGVPEPASAMAGFESAAASIGSPEPVSAMAGFDSSVPERRTYRRTVARSIPSSRLIRRYDQPCPTNAKIACTSAILS